ncbi:MAG: hypothetical protein WBC44_15245 [Planctomycetaceae bacterium]
MATFRWFEQRRREPLLVRSVFLTVIGLATHQIASAQEGESSEPQESYSVEEILDAWRSYQEQVRSGRIVWRETFLLDTSGYDIAIPDPELQMRLKAQELLATETIKSYAFDDRRARLTQEAVKGDERVPSEALSVFDGRVSKGWERRPSVEFPQGSVSRQPIPPRGLVEFKALMLTFHPFDPTRRPFDPSGLRMTDRTEVVDGRECLVAEVPGRASSGTSLHVLRIDPARDLHVVRSTYERDGVTESQLDVEYAADEAVGWVLSGWRYHRTTPAGKLTHDYKAEVTEIEINPTLPDELFQLEFPPGTRYTDIEAGKLYIVQEPGTPREITRQELRSKASQEELMTTRTGRASALVDGGWNWWIVSFVCGVAALVLACVLVWRRYRHRTT